TAPAADEYNKSSQFLTNLSNSGYDSLVNANQLIKYYAYEYAVLMDAAEYLEVVGVTTIAKSDSGKVDFEAKIEVSKYQREIVSRVMQSYQKGDLRNAAIPPKADKKKKNGWWQKLLKKPQSKLPED
ncbi:MAG: hypothetical protein J5821_04235, partial [Alphaproteobacteria bacterium]|nr:hypothetical protein [Alphaproteobacteria bacterium]